MERHFDVPHSDAAKAALIFPLVSSQRLDKPGRRGLGREKGRQVGPCKRPEMISYGRMPGKLEGQRRTESTHRLQSLRTK